MDYRAQPGPENYTARKDTPLEDRHTIQREKFVLILQAICTCGQQSRTFITNESLDATLYIKNCLKIQLLSSIR